MGYVTSGRNFAVGDAEETDARIPSASNLVPILDTPHTWVLYGIIDYRDIDDTRHWRTTFCRAWDDRRQRFIPVDDPDYEYED